MGLPSCSQSAPWMLLLCCSLEQLCVASQDYDDYAVNSTDEHPGFLGDGLCPRAIPAELVIQDNITYLSLLKAPLAQLSSPITVLLIPGLYTLVFLVGLPANGLALWVLATRVEKLTSTVFLMNLAAADLLLGLVLPLKIAYYFLGNHWPFGEGLCRFTTAAFYGNMYCSVLLLACISVDRYLAVVHPFSSRSFRSPAFAACTCTAVWGAAAAFTLPLMLLRQSYPLVEANINLCHDALPRYEETQYYYHYFICLIVVGFVGPLGVMLLSSVAVLQVLLRGGQRYANAVKLTALVLLTVVVFYTPSNVLLLVHYSHSCHRLHGDLYVAYMGSLALSACNSCLDPFIYYYVSEDFRAKVRGRLLRHRKHTITSLKTSKETLPPKSSRSQSLV
uniref:Proteinase-activated receptor 4 n=1 Tax=Sphenodon punctatus TaxID=8508 RepID=A0A8D0L6C3_SPHPU